MFKELKKGVIAGTALVTLVFAGTALADEHDSVDDIRDLSALTCRDLLLAAGEDRDAVILVLHAYLLGEAKQPVYNVDILAEATDGFMDACIDEPDSPALETMRKQFTSD